MLTKDETEELEALKALRSFREGVAARYLTLISGYDWSATEVLRLAERGEIERARGSERGWWKYKRSSLDEWHERHRTDQTTVDS